MFPYSKAAPFPLFNRLTGGYCSNKGGVRMNWANGIKAAVISVIIAVVFTFLASLIIPTDDLTWALIAVTFAAFFSGFFSAQRNSERYGV
jgi:chromate transport protein ChrA